VSAKNVWGDGKASTLNRNFFLRQKCVESPPFFDDSAIRKILKPPPNLLDSEQFPYDPVFGVSAALIVSQRQLEECANAAGANEPTRKAEKE
jgi:hypothetical protein